MKNKEVLASYGPAPFCIGGRMAGGLSKGRKARGNLAPETASSTKLWAGTQLLTKSSLDPGWLTSARRVAVRDQLPRGDVWHTWDGALTVHLGNWAVGTEEVIRCTTHLGRVCLPRTWSPELLGPGKGTKCRPNLICAFVEYLRRNISWNKELSNWTDPTLPSTDPEKFLDILLLLSFF